jgi:Na+-transporting NADH:ubiquinone oxidoreductase subunit F
MGVVRAIHKWFGLLVGLQMTIWMLSGFAMAALNMGQVRGADRIDGGPPPQIERGVAGLDILRPAFEGAVAVTLRPGPDASVYQVEGREGVVLHRAADASAYAITRERAMDVARNDYAGPGRPVSAERMDAPFLELRKHEGPVWRVDIDDARSTTLYVDALTGAVLERRNDIWRVFDVFWMLHTMDYVGRDNFNNPLVIIAGLAALWLALSGFLMLFSSFRGRDFDLVSAVRRWRGGTVPCTVRAPGAEACTVGLAPGLSYFDALSKTGLDLPSNCGGAGTCGQCVLELSPARGPDKADLEHLSPAEIAGGVRLGCRHRVRAGTDLTLPEGVLDDAPVSGQVCGVRYLSPFIKELRIRLDAPLDRASMPGQYMQLAIPAGEVRSDASDVPECWRPRWSALGPVAVAAENAPLRRSYSMAAAPHENPRELVMNIRIVPPAKDGAPWGRGSAYAFGLRTGDPVSLHGPYGRFAPSNEAGSLVLIGGGSGMAPLRSIIRHEYSASGRGRPIQLFYGARTEDDILYREEFDRLQVEQGGFEWVVALSDAEASPCWTGARGLIHDVARAALSDGNPDLEKTEFLLCGPPALISASRSMLESLGVSRDAIRTEDFGV